MREIIIFGNRFEIVEQKSDKDSVEIKSSKIIVNRWKRKTKSLIKEFLTEKLYDQLFEIYEEIKKEGKIEILGNLDFEIVEHLDRKQRIAKLKGDKILVKLNAITLPKPALKYVVAHEIAHIFTKRHTKKFWETVKMIYPEYETGQKILIEYKKILATPL